MHDHRGGVRRSALTRLAPVAVVVTLLTAGCTGSGSSSDGSPAPSDTPLSAVDLTGVAASRASFCDSLDPDAVAAVLGGAPEKDSSYGSGQRAELAPGLKDVSHEFSCTFDRGPREARAWLFAQPATAAQARGWIKERTADDSCKAAGELTFGDPGLVQLCRDKLQLRVTAAGLFGDGYLTCKVTAPPKSDETDLLDRAQRWCADVAVTVGQTS